MSKQLAKVIYHGTYKVIFNEFDEEKPCRVIHEYSEYKEEEGRLTLHRQQKIKTDRLSECLEYIGNTIRMLESAENLV